jgi:intermediate peptidase
VGILTEQDGKDGVGTARKQKAKMRTLRRTNPIASVVKRGMGLFGIRGLNAPHDFPRLATECLSKAHEEINWLLASNHRNPHATITALDRISKLICAIIDPAELCRSVHSNDNFKAASEEAFHLISDFINKLNGDQRVFSIICGLLDSKISAQFSAEETMLLVDLKSEYENNGIHLCDQDRADLITLLNDIVDLESEFMRALSTDSRETFLLGPSTSLSSSLQHWIKNSIPQTGQEPANMLTCVKDKGFVNTLFHHIDSQSIRQQLWKNTYVEPSNNVATLGKLIQSRQLLAQSLGYPSYAHKFLQGKAAQSPENVHLFLRAVSDATRPHAEKAMLLLKNYLPKDGIPQMGPWDIRYCMHQHKLHDVHSPARAKAFSALADYMSVETCIDGLKLISLELFGLHFVDDQFSSFDGWAVHDKDTSFGVRKLRVLSEQRETIGILYLDLWQRNNKFPGNAHFTVQCGCKGDSQTSEYFNSSGFQVPVVALVFNFGRQTPKLLSLVELEILYHEWGHALHSLLSQTHFQHLSGTRSALDFSEVSPTKSCPQSQAHLRYCNSGSVSFI